MPPRRRPTSAGHRILARLLPRSRPRALRVAAAVPKARALARPGPGRARGAGEPHRVPERLRNALRLLLVMALLGAINLYVLYYRRGTSVPDLLRAAEVGRQASLLPGLQGPPGTPPRLLPRKAGDKGGLRAEYLRTVEVSSAEEEHLGDVLAQAGLSGKEAGAVQAVLKELGDGHLVPGQKLVFYYDLEDRLQAIDYEKEEGLGFRLERTPAGSVEHWSRQRLEGAVRVRPVVVSGTLTKDGGLYEAVQRAGEGRPLAGLLADVFAYDQDLVGAGRAGDRFRVVVEKIYRGSQFYRYGAVLAAHYEGPAGALRAVRHAPAGQEAAYYSAEGEELRRPFLRTPLRLQRPAGRPALHVERKRLLGADFPALAGTPVRALAAGKVSGRERGRDGLVLTITHSGGVETSYGRLGRLARGVAEGQAVRAGQVVGYVAAGDKGRPAHLHLSVRVGGKVVDPLRLQVPRGATLPPAERLALRPLLEQLEGREMASR